MSALNHIFDALHIGVYSGDGTPIVSGAETSSDDFYFYEPEVQMLAASLERGDRWSVDDIVAVLNGPHVLSQDITSEQLERAIANRSGMPLRIRPPGVAGAGLVQALAVQHGSPNELTGMTDTSAPYWMRCSGRSSSPTCSLLCRAHRG